MMTTPRTWKNRGWTRARPAITIPPNLDVRRIRSDRPGTGPRAAPVRSPAVRRSPFPMATRAPDRVNAGLQAWALSHFDVQRSTFGVRHSYVMLGTALHGV